MQDCVEDFNFHSDWIASENLSTSRQNNSTVPLAQGRRDILIQRNFESGNCLQHTSLIAVLILYNANDLIDKCGQRTSSLDTLVHLLISE